MKYLIAILAFTLIAPAFAEKQPPVLTPPQLELTKPCTSYTKECTPLYSLSGPGFVFGPWVNACAYMMPEQRIYDKKNKAWVYIPGHEEVDQHCMTIRAVRGYQELNRIDPAGVAERNKLMIKTMCEDADMRKALNTVQAGFCK